MVSHASTDAVRDAAFPLDEPLDTGGEAKARALAASLRRVDAAWSSPALRARQTAVALGLDAATDPVLRDIDLGRWAGQSFDANRMPSRSGSQTPMPRRTAVNQSRICWVELVHGLRHCEPRRGDRRGELWR
jgi:hypothetical protein